MDKKPKIEIVAVLAIIAIVVLYFNFQLGTEPFLLTSPMELPQLGDIFPETDFQKFAVIVTFAYDMLPTVAQQFSISAITVQLLMTGFSPIVLAVLSALGLLVGQMILYVVGMIFRHLHRGGKFSFGNVAGDNHWLHKYHFLIYILVPFVGILGDGTMLYSGHEKINPLKIIPFLFVADLASTARWIIPTMAELEISEHLSGS